MIVCPCAPPLAATAVSVRMFETFAERRSDWSTLAGSVKRRSLLPALRAPAPSDVEPMDACSDPSPLDWTISLSWLSAADRVSSSGP